MSFDISLPLRPEEVAKRVQQLGGTLEQLEHYHYVLQREVSGRVLHLEGRHINDAVVEPLLVAIPDLLWLGLGETAVRGECFRGLAGARQLLHVVVYDSPLNDSAFHWLQAARETLCELTVVDSQITDQSLAGLANLKQLFFLDLTKTALTDLGVKHLEKLPRLAQLIVAETAITDAGLKRLSTFSSWQNMYWLGLSLLPITDGGLKTLGLATSLAMLWLRGSLITDRGLDHLRDCPLVDVCVSETKVSDAGCHTLAQFRSLTSIELDGTEISDHGLRHFATLTELGHLTLANTNITARGLAVLVDLPKLRILDVQGTDLNDLSVDVLSRFKHLEHLTLPNDRLSRRAVQHLRELLPQTQIDDGSLAATNS